MAYNLDIAQQMRRQLEGLDGLSEQKMFGGIGFLLHGNMCVGVSHTSLIVRLGPEQADLARGQPHVVEFDVAGRPRRYYRTVRVP